jgi:hypothetical protein
MSVVTGKHRGLYGDRGGTAEPCPVPYGRLINLVKNLARGCADEFPRPLDSGCGPLAGFRPSSGYGLFPMRMSGLLR